MRTLLLLALLLYDVVALATRPVNNDYEEVDSNTNKRHLYDEHRNWRKKALMKPHEEHKEWDDHRRRDYDAPAPRYAAPDDGGDKSFAADHRDGFGYKRHFDGDGGGGGGGGGGGEHMPPAPKSSEMHQSYNMDKDAEKKLAVNCERPHEKFEACFAGCASVTCDNPRDRLRPCYPFCEQGCICIPPYVRDDRTHKCVMPEDCTRGLKGIPDLGDEL